MKKHFTEIKHIMYTDKIKERVAANRIQMSVGMLVENNIINALEHYCNGVTRLTDEYDMCFGADFKMYFSNGTESFVDVTCNNKKDFFTPINFHGSDIKEKLSNGMVAHVGFKKETKNFKYKKPILVVYIEMPREIYPIFTEKDIRAIAGLLQIGSFMVSKKMNYYTETGIKKTGYGNMASEIVHIENEMFKKIITNQTN